MESRTYVCEDGHETLIYDSWNTGFRDQVLCVECKKPALQRKNEPQEEVYEPLNPHATTQKDKDLRLIALAATAHLAYLDGRPWGTKMFNPKELAEALDRLAGVDK